MPSRVPDMLRASWVTQEAVITGLMLYLAAAPIALSLALLTHPLAFVLWTLMWLPGFMARRWPRLVLLLLLTPVLLVAIASLARPPAAPFFMLAVLIFSAADQVQEDGRPGAFNLVGVIFSALCVMVLSNGIFIFLMLLVSVILYTGIMTLRINRMPLSGLRIRLMPIVAALSGALFFAVVAFVLLPRVNPAVLPGLIDPTARTGVGDRLELGKFAEVIADDAEAFRAFLPEALPPDELYWRVYLLSRMQGAQWQRETPPTNRLGPRGYSKSLTPEKATDPARALVRYGVRAVEVVPKEQPVLGAPVAVDSPDISLNVWGEVRPSVGQSNLPREIRLLSHLGNPFAADLTNSIEVSGQPRLQAWARQLRAEVASPSAFAERLLQHFAEAGYRYSLSPQQLDLPDAVRVDGFFFETKTGYCSHYAMAMATALRAAGIPANVIVGYQGGSWNPFGNYYLVRKSDAHAWVEAEIEPGLWRRYDPTRKVPEAQQFFTRRSTAQNISQSEGWQGEWARFMQRTDAFVTRLNSDIVLYDEEARQELLSGQFFERAMSFGLFWLLGSIGFALPIIFWRSVVRRDAMHRFDLRYARLARRDGLTRRADEGRLAFAARWQAALAGDENGALRGRAIGLFAALWCQIQFGSKPLPEARQTLSNLLRDIKTG